MAGPPAITGSYETLGELIVGASCEIGDHEAYVEIATGRRLTFRQWADAAAGLAEHLRSVGLQRGDVLAVWISPSIDYAIVCAAGALVGAVVSGINVRLGPREIAGIWSRAQPAIAIIEPGSVVPEDTATIVVERTAIAQVTGDITRFVMSPEVHATDPATIIWTSGTTGLPKGAWHNHRSLAAAVQTAGEMTAMSDRRLMGLPLAHAGYMAKLWEQWAMGVTLVLTPAPWSAESMLAVLVDERITVAAAVPTQWAKLLELPAVDTADFSTLRICVAATAPAAPELVERIRTVLGAPVIVRYAMTESPSITGTSADDSPDVQYRTVGRPQAGVHISLVDSDGAEVAPGQVGQVGQVRVKGPCVMRGYWNDAEATTRAFDVDGWLTSGDLGYLDPLGNLVLAGRLGDMYIRGGYNVYPLEVENVLAEHPAITAVALVGESKPVIGEIGVAYIVAAPGVEPPTLEAVRAWVRERLADYKAPDDLVVVDALPLTAMGKVNRAALAR